MALQKRRHRTARASVRRTWRTRSFAQRVPCSEAVEVSDSFVSLPGTIVRIRSLWRDGGSPGFLIKAQKLGKKKYELDNSSASPTCPILVFAVLMKPDLGSKNSIWLRPSFLFHVRCGVCVPSPASLVCSFVPLSHVPLQEPQPRLQRHATTTAG